MAKNSLDIDITPIPYKKMTYKGKWVASGNQRYFDYKKEIQWRIQEVGYEPGEALELKFLMPMPPSWSEKKKDKHLGRYHKQRPDLTNLIKAVEDAMFYRESKGDQKVCAIIATKKWAVKGHITVVNRQLARSPEF